MVTHPGRRPEPPRKGLFQVQAPYLAALGAFLLEALVLPRSGRGRRWRKKSPQDTLSQKVLRIAPQHGAKARGGGTPSTPCPSRESMRGPHSNGGRQSGAGGLPAGPLAVSPGPTWAGNRRKLLHSLRAGERPGLQVSPSPFLLCDDPRLFTVIPNRGLSRGEGAPL